MNTLTKHTTVRFTAPFSLRGVDEVQPPGDYAIDEDEELIDGLSRLAYRRVAIHSPAGGFPDRPSQEPACGYRPRRTRRRASRGCGTGATRKQEDPAMNVHRFTIGQSVRMKGTIGMSLQTGHMFRITGRMPARDNSLQYRIRNDEERHERMVAEGDLDEIKIGPF
jgi:hypothetical protein